MCKIRIDRLGSTLMHRLRKDPSGRICLPTKLHASSNCESSIDYQAVVHLQSKKCDPQESTPVSTSLGRTSGNTAFSWMEVQIAPVALHAGLPRIALVSSKATSHCRQISTMTSDPVLYIDDTSTTRNRGAVLPAPTLSRSRP
jgi:hypothetical protein